MLGRAYENQTCSVAGALEFVGERWTLLIVRDAFQGIRRYEDFQRRLGIARNILSARLDALVENGLFSRTPYQEHPLRYEYQLTDKGRDLWPVMFALLRWGDKHVYPDAPPIVHSHKHCGGAVSDRRTCEACGAEVGPEDVVVRSRRGDLRGLPTAQ